PSPSAPHPHPPLNPKCPPPSTQRSPTRALLHPPPVTRSSGTSGRYRLRLRNRPRSAARQPNDVQRVHPLHRIARVEHRNGQVDQLLVADVGVVGGDHDRKSTRLNSSHVKISYAAFCLQKKRQAPAPRPGPARRRRR